MPRERRAWEPGQILGVVGRAHEGRPIFAGEDDRRFFVDRLRRVFVPDRVRLLAWALQVNHYHLVIRVTDVPPGELLLQMNTPIGQRERRRRGDHGAVFQDRFWSGVCETEGSEIALLTYVLGNPVHHGVVATAEALETYPWTAYPEILGRSASGLVDAGQALSFFDPDPATALHALRAAMSARVARWQAERAGVDPCDEPGCLGEREGCALVHASGTRAGPQPAGPAALLRPAAGISRVHDERADRRARLESVGWRPADLVAPVCARLDADPEAVLRGGRLHAESRARSVIAHVACDGVGVAVGPVAALVGVSGPALTVARRRGRSLLLERGWTIDEVLSWTAGGR